MRVLIVGLGSIAAKHIQALREIDPLINIDALRSSPDYKEYEGVKSILYLPETPEYDFIIISNPTSLHAKTLNELYKFGIPIMIEKPLFEDVLYNDLIDNIEKSGILSYVACNLRFLGCISFLHDFIKENQDLIINEVNVYCGSYLPEWRPVMDFKKSYSANPKLGGGVHLDLIHEIDYVCYLFGRPKKSLGICRNVSSLNIDSIDYANYILMYEDFTASIVLNYYRRDYKRTIEIVFDNCTWTADLKLNTIRDNNGKIIYKGNQENTYKKQILYFLDLIKRKEKAENDIKYAYDTLKIAMKYEGFEG